MITLGQQLPRKGILMLVSGKEFKYQPLQQVQEQQLSQGRLPQTIHNLK
jgi:hypothetical protein